LQLGTAPRWLHFSGKVSQDATFLKLINQIAGAHPLSVKISSNQKLDKLTLEELMVSTLAMTDALAKLLIAKGIIMDEELHHRAAGRMQRISRVKCMLEAQPLAIPLLAATSRLGITAAMW
jgi:hypothetical protein